jgi:ACR3 family arsenite efflux pump ArsB
VAIEREDIMGKNDSAKIGFFEKYLTIWVVLCMVIGVLIGMYLPGIPDFLGRFEYARVSSGNQHRFTVLPIKYLALFRG